MTTTRNCNSKKYVGGSNEARFMKDKLLYRQYSEAGTIYNSKTEKKIYNIKGSVVKKDNLYFF